MADSIKHTIETQAKAGVKSGTDSQGRSFGHMSIQELIEAERYLAAKKAAKKPHFGLRMTKIVPPAGG